MRRRLYFVLPDVSSGRALVDELLLARIEITRMHFLAKDDCLQEGMPCATLLQKTDLVHGVQLGAVIGGIVGFTAGIFLTMFPMEGLPLQSAAILLVGLGGAIFGGWASGMNAAAVPNTRLSKFSAAIEAGKVLLILDVPTARVEEIEAMIAQRHPEIGFGGMEPPMLAFP